MNGWYGNLACGLSYESLPWITAAAVMSGGAPAMPVLILATLYGLGAHGIMTLNDFKSIEGDTHIGVRTLPVQLGPERAALVACWVMAVPQMVVIGLLFHWGAPWYAAVVMLLLAGQVAAMIKMLGDPRKLAPWYNATGILMYVLGMLTSSIAVRGMA